MATTLTFVKATPYSAVYTLDGGAAPGGLGTLDFTNAPTLANLAAGPLKSEIIRRLALGTLADLNLNLDSNRVRIYIVTGIDEVTQILPPTLIYWVAVGLAAQVPFQVESAVGHFQIEIRFEHSEKR